ncbi:hypothetical protein TIFTF001_028881 [Ficus carica]|uniref:Uncharacterized protein n=1 Tax=Ficus carica TaxID=3494 RepID=A0AA88DQT1_FICCA|nr:hypothetical protein TIFTF001_028881 [Ficus carica]
MLTQTKDELSVNGAANGPEACYFLRGSVETPVGDSLKLNVDASLEPTSNFVRVGSICNLVRICGTRRRLCFGHICEEDNEGAYPICCLRFWNFGRGSSLVETTIECLQLKVTLLIES